MGGPSHDHAPTNHGLVFDSPMMAAFAELEAEVLIGLVTQAASMLAGLCRRHAVEVRRVLDLGCGPGVGTTCLAGRFDSATIVAVDGSPTMLQHVTGRAERLGLAQRVETCLAELPALLDTLGRADVVWASMVLHHVGDQATALRRIRELLGTGGLLAILEQAHPLRVLPEDVDLGRPGLWDRLDAAWASWFAEMRADLAGATTAADYPAMLEEAGFELVADEVLTLALDAPLEGRSRRFALDHLTRTSAQLASHAHAGDLEALEVLTDDNGEASILHREDAVLRASRHLYVARALP